MKTPSLKQMVDELIAANMQRGAIARAMGVDPGIVTRIVNGHGTNYDSGKALEALYRKHKSERGQ